jgi:plastocyanin
MAPLPSLFVMTSLLLSAVASARADSAVEGRVEVAKQASAPVVTKRYQVVTKAGVVEMDPAQSVVYLEGPFAKPSTAPRAQMSQKDLMFATPLLPVQVGTVVEFPNLDDTYHNIFSYSKAKRFDLGRYRSDERPIPSQVFDQPGLVTLHCDIHQHMRGLILVLETPFYTKTESGGSYKLSGLPAGHYTLKAWVNSKTTLEKPVDLKNGQTAHVDFP